MILRGIDFGSILNTSGACGFFGEGYWYHRWVRWAGLDFQGATFVAKTTTLDARAGNLPLGRDGITPKELMPRSIVVRPWRGVAINAVGLSGPGARFLLETGRWQQRTSPFFLSFMSVAGTTEERLDELGRFVELLAAHLPSFGAPVGLQLNVSCPNVGLHKSPLLDEIPRAVAVASALQLPLMAKISVLSLTPEASPVLSATPGLDGLVLSNTVPWSQLGDAQLEAKRLFGRTTSPLAKLGGGGVSGAALHPLVCDWVRRARAAGLKLPVLAEGGTLSQRDIDEKFAAGADAVGLGSVAFLRPWRVRGMIRHVQARQKSLLSNNPT